MLSYERQDLVRDGQICRQDHMSAVLLPVWILAERNDCAGQLQRAEWFGHGS